MRLHVLCVGCLCLCIMVEKRLFIDELFELIDLKTVHFEVEVEVADWCAEWLIVLLMQLGHVGMLQCALDSDSLFGVKLQHFLAEIDGVRVLAHAQQLIEVLTLLLR